MNKSWRITTAVRAFAFATLLGQCLSTGAFGHVGPLLAALAIVAIGVTVHEARVDRSRVPWSPVAEGVIVGVLVAVASTTSSAGLLYLAIPTVAAGVRYGWLTTVNTGLAGGLAYTCETVRLEVSTADQLGAALPWMVVGCGSGLLAAHLTRSMRRLSDAQAPLASAHRVVTELSRLLEDRTIHVDASTQAEDLLAMLREHTRAHSGSLFVRNSDGDEESLTSFGASAQEAAGSSTGEDTTLTAPLRVGDHVFGRIVLEGVRAPALEASALQTIIDGRAIGLETALLIERVRVAATVEERHRLARDLHDGAAQQVVGLLWMIDEMSAECTDPVALARTEELRAESNRLVNELRFSLFDLHHDLESCGGLAAALTSYVSEVGDRSDLRVHLTLDAQDLTLPRRAEAEILRIAQEAVGNVRRHARAINLWVTLVVRGTEIRLVIEDDGIGGALPRPGHYGLHTMRERARHLGADLEVGPRPDGGTAVRLITRTVRDVKEDRRDDDRLAHR